MACERYGCLPRQGGLLDQDNKLVKELFLVVNAIGKKLELESKKNAK